MAKKQTSKSTTPKKAAPAGKADRDIHALLAAKTRPTMDFPISSDITLADARDEAKERLDQVKERVDRANTLAARLPGELGERAEPGMELLDELESAQAEYDEALKAATAVEIPFVLEAMPRPKLVKLYRQFPPTDKQKKKYRDEMKALGKPITIPLDVNEDEVPPHLIFHSMKSPEVTLEDVMGWWHGPECEECDSEGCEDCEGGRRPDLGVWSRAELDGLFLACSRVNSRIK